MTLTTILFVGLAGLFLFAVPPKSAESLRQESDLIVVAHVAKIEASKQENSPGFSDTIYTITLAVTKAEKGKVGASVVAMTSQPAERPQGWAGPQGQHVIPNAGDSIRAFLKKSPGDTYAFLVPNGLELIEPTTQPTSQPAE